MARQLETPIWGKSMASRIRRSNDANRRPGCKSDGKKGAAGRKKTWWEVTHPDTNGVMRRIRVADPAKGRAFFKMSLQDRMELSLKSGKTDMVKAGGK